MAKRSNTPATRRKAVADEGEGSRGQCRDCALIHDLAYPSAVDGRPTLGRCKYNKHGGRFLDLLSREACPHFQPRSKD
nr:MAG TPA: hypothetical protein [Caudoviricetes sp.]